MGAVTEGGWEPEGGRLAVQGGAGRCAAAATRRAAAAEPGGGGAPCAGCRAAGPAGARRASTLLSAMCPALPLLYPSLQYKHFKDLTNFQRSTGFNCSMLVYASILAASALHSECSQSPFCRNVAFREADSTVL